MLITFLHLHHGIKEAQYQQVDNRMDVGEMNMDAALFFEGCSTMQSCSDVKVCKLQKQKC